VERMTSPIARFRRQLEEGQVCLGASVSFGDPLVTEALADSLDFLWIDLEHSPMSGQALMGHLLAARARRVPSLVRVAGGGAHLVKPVLDAGADGIILPQARTAEEVRQLADNCRYPPLGRRGFGPRVPSNYGRVPPDECVASANREVFVAAQIENVEGLEMIEEILAVAGLDSLVIGPRDLALALGAGEQMDHPRVVAAMETIISKTRAAGLYVGCGMGPDPGYAIAMANRGVQWLQVGGDWSYLAEQVDRVTASVRSRLTQSANLRGEHR